MSVYWERGVALQNMYLLSSQKLHTQFRWNLTTIFTTRNVLKFVHNNKKLGSKGFCGGLPSKICICFLFWSHTHNFDETWPQPLSPVMYQGLFMAENKKNFFFTFFSITYFVGHPCLPVVAWLSYPAITRWASRGIGPMFNISVRFFVIIPVAPAFTGTTLAFFSFLDLLTSFF